MPHDEDPGAEPESPESLFASWLRHHRAGEELDFEALCSAHGEHEARLRELRERWAELAELERRFGLTGTLGDQLTARYGADVDPRIVLEREDSQYGTFGTRMLGRLSGRSAASGRYRLKGEVAAGGMGAILRVWDEDLRRHLAMKVMLAQSTGQRSGASSVDERLLARFLEEAQITGQLDHPGIVPVHELGLDVEGRVYFTMKLVKGRDLRATYGLVFAGEEGWTRLRALRVLLKVCEAMHYAHDKRVIHRDLKPANIMVGRYGEVFVMDWGLAKILDGEESRDIRIQPEPSPGSTIVLSDRHDHASDTPDSPLFTMDGDVVGTPAYMSPEQAGGRLRAMGPHSDVYSIGAMIYHLYTGSMPYADGGEQLGNRAIWARLQIEAPTPLAELAPDTPPELVAICEKAMQREIELRYPGVDELAADLSSYLEGRVVKAYEAGPWAEARKWIRRNGALSGALAAGILALVAGLVVSSSLYLRAEESADLARAQTAQVLRLADAKRVAEFEQQVADLWPPHPEQIEAYEAWVAGVEELGANLPEHRETLAQLRLRAGPRTAHERERDRSSHPARTTLAGLQAERDAAVLELEAGVDGSTAVELEARIDAMDEELDALEPSIEERRTWTFETNEDQWQHDVLTELVAGIEALVAGPLEADGVDPEDGWSIPRRLAAAVELRDGADGSGSFAARWRRDLPAIRAAYPGLELEPQVGLVPIGADPDSGLWEFWHVLSGSEPRRDRRGRLELEEDSGIVLVLLGPDTFWMGAQRTDPAGHNYDPGSPKADPRDPNYDPGARPNETLREVSLSAHFLGKHELTQGQWLRLTGRNPSHFGPHAWDPAWARVGEAPSLLQPVEQVSWSDCMRWLPRFGLALPSEAQWEHGARGGTETPWWTGSTPESLQGAANLAEAFARERMPDLIRVQMPWDEDGWATHAPVGRFRANPFGLHDTAGNVWEWCLDGYGAYDPTVSLDPVAPFGSAGAYVFRGGCYGYLSAEARSADRRLHSPTERDDFIGLRVARAIEP